MARTYHRGGEQTKGLEDGRKNGQNTGAYGSAHEAGDIVY